MTGCACNDHGIIIQGLTYKNNPQLPILNIERSLYMNWSRLDTLPFRQLRAFCAVARLSSYTRAARELGCQQPTVSALVAELEQASQLTLFEQWGKRLAWRDEGRELFVQAHEVVEGGNEAWQAMAALREAGTVESLPLRVAADTT